MGSGKRLIVSASGFPGTTETWRFIQKAWREPLEALAYLSGDKVIVSGMITAGNAVSNGFISFEGAIYPFEGGNMQSTITLVKEVVESTYDVDLDNDGQQDSLPQYENAYFRFGSGGANTFLYSNLTRLKTIKELSEFSLPSGVVIDPNYIPLTQALITTLSNVQSDWNVTNNQSDAFIKNKPSLFKPLRVGSSLLGDFPNSLYDEKRTISFPSIGTSDYIILGSFVSVRNNTTDWELDNNIIWSVGKKNSTSFEIYGAETTGTTQNVRFDYMLISSGISIYSGSIINL